MASVRKSRQRTGSIRWQAIWREPGAGGSARQRTRNFDTRKEAVDYAARMRREIEGHGVGDRDKHSTERFLRRWWAFLVDRNEHSPTTLASYRRNIEIAGRYIGDIPLEKISPSHLDALYSRLLKHGAAPRKDGTRQGRGLSPRSVLHVHRALHTAFERARKWRMIAANPATDATAPSVRQSAVRAYTHAELDRILTAAAADRETYAIIVTLLITGLRRSELIGLCWDAVDLDQGTLAVRRVVLEVERQSVLRDVPKSKSSERVIEIPPLLVDLLRAQKAHVLQAALAWGKSYRREPSMFCFPQVNGEPHDPMGLTYRLRQVMRRAKVEGRAPVHALRHTAATALVGAGSDIRTISARLGHSTPAITLCLYVHPSQERDRTAGEHLAKLIKRKNEG